MLHIFSTWLVAILFLGAGIFNAIGTPGTVSDFSRWGYPKWWNIFTGGLEIVTAGLSSRPQFSRYRVTATLSTSCHLVYSAL